MNAQGDVKAILAEHRLHFPQFAEKESESMWPYVMYFLIGGTIVSLAAYVGSRGDGMAAAFVASIPVIFITNLVLLYHNGGVSAGLTYAKGALMYVTFCVVLTMVLLPRIGMPWSLLAGMSVYSLSMAFARPSPQRRQVNVSAAHVQVPGHIGSSSQVSGDEKQIS
jgi:hypothetical protein